MKKIISSFLSLLFLVSTASAQCTEGDCVNGKGTYVYPSGAKYIGEFKDGEIHGVGVCFYSDGSKYSGEWSHRYPEGKGTKTFADGTKWTGFWKQGQPVDEYGEYVDIYSGGDDGLALQSGCITGDCEDGKGTYAYPDGSKYDGQFRAEMPDGWGTWYYPGGERYIGSFADGLPHGRGTFFDQDGTETTGEWEEGDYIGQAPSNEDKVGCIKGDCEDGEGVYVYEDHEAVYTGTFSNGKAHGSGICRYANGDRYEGQWAYGWFEGMGTLYLTDDVIVQGYWQEGEFMGEEAPMPEETYVSEDVEMVEPTVEPAVNTNPTRTEAQPNGNTKPETAVTTQPTAPTSDLAVSAKKTDLNVYALVIGISSYSHMPALRYTDDDAYRMYAFLKSPEGGALPDDHLRILVDEEATKQNILKDMQELFAKAGSKDLVLLYFSGHGLKGSFLPIDFDGYNNRLFHEEVAQIFESTDARYKLCIADACHSGSLNAMKGLSDQTLITRYYQSLAESRGGTALIMSSKSDETSLESSGLRQGVFSHFLIRGLKGEADTNKDKLVNIKELFAYIHKNVRTYTAKRQSPVLSGDYDPNMTVSVTR